MNCRYSTWIGNSVVLFFLSLPLTVIAQKTWTLEKCLQYLEQNHLTISLAQLDIKTAELEYTKFKRQRMPSIDAYSNVGIQFGWTIDPTNNSFDNQEIGFNNLNVGGNVILFSGGQIRNNISGSKHLLAAAKAQKTATLFRLKLDVIGRYFGVLLAEEQLQQGLASLKLSNDQLVILQKEIKEGTRSLNEGLELQSQIDRQEQLVSRYQYEVRRAKELLKNGLLLPFDETMKLDLPKNVVRSPAPVDWPNWRQFAQDVHPEVRVAKANLAAAEYNLKAAKSAFFPTIKLFGRFYSNYSSVARRENLSAATTTVTPLLVDFNGERTQLDLISEGYELERDPYFNQIKDNFGQAIGISFSIPILKRGESRAMHQTRQVELLQLKYEMDRVKKNLEFELQNSILDVESAWEIYSTGLKSVETFRSLVKKKGIELKLGVIGLSDYFIVRNQLEESEIQLLRSKYDLLFKQKVLQLYR